MTLRPEKRQAQKRKFSSYDLEWTPHDLSLRLIGCYDERGYRSYEKVVDFLNAELTAENHKRWFYAHAGGLYDIRFVLHDLILRANVKVRVSASFAGSSAIIVKIEKGRHHWFLLDSYWTIRQPLRKVGEWMGLEKGGKDPEDVDLGIGNEGQKAGAGGEKKKRCERSFDKNATCTCPRIFFADAPTLRTYNERDCEILWRALDFFQDQVLELGGELKMTIASTALDLFRRRFLTRTIKTSPRLNDIARRAYVASRVEVYSQRCDEANYYDVNSSFPYAMTFDAPGAMIGTKKGLPTGDEIYLAHARVRVPDCAVPPLPYRTNDHRVYFPRGEWEDWFSSEDLHLLEAAGGEILSCKESLIFEKFDDLRGYSETIYGKRQASESEAFKIVLKFLLNALYGKFSEQSEKQQLLVNPVNFECPHRTRGSGAKKHESDECMRYFLPGVYIASEEKSVPHAHVPIAVHITAIARKVLWQYMNPCSRVHYCDTDGFACAPSDVFPDSKKLGELKFEKTISEGRFVAPKLYSLLPKDSTEWIVRSKGFSNLSYSEFCQLIEGGEVLVDRFVRLKEGLKRGRIAPEENPFKKQLRQKLRPKRRFLTEGGSVPWDVNDLSEKWDGPGIGEKKDPM